MGFQTSIFQDQATEAEFGINQGAAGAETYIIDLLAELQTIAKVGGLTRLSDDISSVLSKHMKTSVAA